MLVPFSVALKIDAKEIIKNKYLKAGLVINAAPNTINNGVAKQCTKQIDALTIPIKSAKLYFLALIIFLNGFSCIPYIFACPLSHHSKYLSPLF